MVLIEAKEFIEKYLDNNKNENIEDVISKLEEVNLIRTGENKEKINIVIRSSKLGFTINEIAKIVDLGEEKVMEILAKNNIDYKI